MEAVWTPQVNTSDSVSVWPKHSCKSEQAAGDQTSLSRSRMMLFHFCFLKQLPVYINVLNVNSKVAVGKCTCCVLVRCKFSSWAECSKNWFWQFAVEACCAPAVWLALSITDAVLPIKKCLQSLKKKESPLYISMKWIWYFIHYKKAATSLKYGWRGIPHHWGGGFKRMSFRGLLKLYVASLDLRRSPKGILFLPENRRVGL